MAKAKRARRCRGQNGMGVIRTARETAPQSIWSCGRNSIGSARWVQLQIRCNGPLCSSFVPDGEMQVILHDHDLILQWKSAEQIMVENRWQKSQVLRLPDHIVGETIAKPPYNLVVRVQPEPVLEIQVVGLEVVGQRPGWQGRSKGNGIVQPRAVKIELQAHVGIVRNGMRPASQDIAAALLRIIATPTGYSSYCRRYRLAKSGCPTGMPLHQYGNRPGPSARNPRQGSGCPVPHRRGRNIWRKPGNRLRAQACRRNGCR